MLHSQVCVQSPSDFVVFSCNVYVITHFENAFQPSWACICVCIRNCECAAMLHVSSVFVFCLYLCLYLCMYIYVFALQCVLHVSSARLFVFIIVFLFVFVYVSVFAFVSASQCVLHVSSAQLGAGNLKTGMGHISLPSYKSSAQDSTNPLFKLMKKLYSKCFLYYPPTMQWVTQQENSQKYK